MLEINQEMKYRERVGNKNRKLKWCHDLNITRPLFFICFYFSFSFVCTFYNLPRTYNNTIFLTLFSSTMYISDMRISHMFCIIWQSKYFITKLDTNLACFYFSSRPFLHVLRWNIIREGCLINLRITTTASSVTYRNFTTDRKWLNIYIERKEN